MKLPKKLRIFGKINKKGIVVGFNNKYFPIIYPKKVWNKYPSTLKKVLLDNVAYSSTIFLPQILNLKLANYQTARPIAETFFYENGMKDMPCSALADGGSSIKYIKRFFNTEYLFKDNIIKTTKFIEFKPKEKKFKTAVIPFSFGKESLLNYALCKELGIKPILVNFIEPSNDFEHFHKKGLIRKFEKETKTKVWVVDYRPGILRYGKYWNLKTELGWGLQTSEYALLTLPFAFYFDADYIVLGNEQSCNDVFHNNEDILTYKAGYDQHHNWTPQQSLLVSLILGRKIEVVSFLDPLYEIAITKILQQRYPEIGHFQMSCMADNKKAAKVRWCQHCVKCGYIYALLAASKINPLNIGFTENLFDKRHSTIYDHFFKYNPKNPLYGSQEELGLAFYLADLNGYKGESIVKFNKYILKKIKPQLKILIRKYLGITSSWVVPDLYKKQLKKIYLEELDNLVKKLN